MDLKQLQEEHKTWADYNFPDRKSFYPLLGMIEEIGELAHADLKIRQGIRGSTEEHRAAAEDAIGDLLIFLADYCNLNGYDLQECLNKAWTMVIERDWQVNKLDGVTS